MAKYDYASKDYAYFRDWGRDAAKSFAVELPRGKKPSNARRLELAREILVVRDAFLSESSQAEVLAQRLIEELSESQLTTWWDHAHELSEVKRFAIPERGTTAAIAVVAYNDGFWTALAKKIAGLKIGQIR
jgi:hypothetical protein